MAWNRRSRIDSAHCLLLNILHKKVVTLQPFCVFFNIHTQVRISRGAGAVSRRVSFG